MKISCIDIGGTYIKSGVLEDGVLTGVEETPTDGGGGARAMLSRVAQLVRQTPGVERVGVSTAGEVDARTGVIRLSDNIPGYTGLNPRQILEGELGLPVAVENDVNAAFTMCLANPPFKGSIDAESISDSLKAVTSTKKTELLFLALFLRLLKKGGQCACIVPDGVLFGSSKAHQSIRRELVEQHQLRAVISMPSGVFKPYAGVSTAVLIFTKTAAGGTGKVWFYDMQADGFSLDDKRTPVAQNDIPDIIARFAALEKEKDRARTEQSFFVQKEEIVANGYDLSLNKYKQVEYTPVEYPPTQQLMTELHELEMQISAGLAELEEML